MTRWRVRQEPMMCLNRTRKWRPFLARIQRESRCSCGLVQECKAIERWIDHLEVSAFLVIRWRASLCLQCKSACLVLSRGVIASDAFQREPKALSKLRRSAKHEGYQQAELVGVGLTNLLGWGVVRCALYRQFQLAGASTAFVRLEVQSTVSLSHSSIGMNSL